MTPRSTSGKRKTDDASEDLEREIEAHAERGRGLARALVEKGKSLVAPLLEQVRDESVDDPAPSMFREAADMFEAAIGLDPENTCLLYTSPSPRDVEESRMPSSA